jgi:alpha-L-rhamnosidase
LSPVQAWHDCRHGRIEAGWVLDGAQVTYRVTLPQGCTGRLAASPQRMNLRLDGATVTVPAGGLAIKAGSHEITFDLTT